LSSGNFSLDFVWIILRCYFDVHDSVRLLWRQKVGGMFERSEGLKHIAGSSLMHPLLPLLLSQGLIVFTAEVVLHCLGIF